MILGRAFSSILTVSSVRSRSPCNSRLSPWVVMIIFLSSRFGWRGAGALRAEDCPVPPRIELVTLTNGYATSPAQTSFFFFENVLVFFGRDAALFF